MPIYEYRCTACERVSEEWVRSFDSPDELDCPHCGKPAKRIMSNTSFQLKGGGWYVTDYGSHKNVPSESGEAPSVSAAASNGGNGETTTPDAAKTAEAPAASAPSATSESAPAASTPASAPASVTPAVSGAKE